jgi:ATP-dependent RNA helicase RhlE
MYPVARAQKTDLLVELLRSGDHTRTIVFTRTKHRADRLSRQLQKAGVSAAAIHGDRSQNQRQAALESFKNGKVGVLVATDVVSRGIDVDEVSHVVNYDMPNTAEDYVHRIGRTARAGASGDAISLLSSEELDVLKDIEKTLGATITCIDIPGFVYAAGRVVPDPERLAVPAPKPAHVPGGHKPRSRRSGRRGGKGRAGQGGSGQGGGQGGSPSGSPGGGNRGA